MIIEWPQSGEVIRGKRHIRELRLAYPTPPTLRRIVGHGDLWATSYYAAPFQAPSWRAGWVEPTSPTPSPS